MEFCDGGNLESLVLPREEVEDLNKEEEKPDELLKEEMRRRKAELRRKRESCFIEELPKKAARELGPTLLSDAEIWGIFVDIVLGLQFLHHQGILHRDLKLSNVLLKKSRSGGCHFTAHLSDFGTAELKSRVQSGSSGFTGTLEYTAPSMLRGGTYNEKCDMWSLGIVLYALCYGHLPYRHEDVDYLRQLICSHGQATFELPIVPFRDSNLKHLIHALLALDPSKRPNTDDLVANPLLKERVWESMLNTTYSGTEPALIPQPFDLEGPLSIILAAPEAFAKCP